METKFNIGDHVYLRGIVREIIVKDSGIKYSVSVADEDGCLCWKDGRLCWKGDEAVIAPSPDVKIKGHWIGLSVRVHPDGKTSCDDWMCSVCGAEFKGEDFDFEYCPRCGNPMNESEE